MASVTDALNQGLAGAERQAKVAGLPYPVAVVKRRGKGPGQAYAVMSLEMFAKMLTDRPKP